MKRILCLIMVVIMLLSAVSCGLLGDTSGEGSVNGGNSNGGNTNGGNSGGNGGIFFPDTPEEEIPEDLKIFNALFDPQSHISVKLDISDSELKKDTAGL